MSIATDLLLDVATEKNGFEIGEPWRFSEFSLVAVVPITRQVEVPRGYRLLCEVGDKVHIKDTGSISRVELVNNGELPVLLKSGEILSGATQERTLVISQVVMAGEQIVAECACVHASKGIRAGQKVRSGGFSPHTVRQTIFKHRARSVRSADPTWQGSYTHSMQSDVWSSVKACSASFAGSGARYMAMAGTNVPGGTTWSTPSDDLTGRVQEAGKKFEAAIKKIPRIVNQVGLCLVSLDGFNALDLFNHPDSWEAIRDNILKAEIGSIADASKKNDMFQFRPKAARVVLSEILTSALEESTAISKKSSDTILLQGDKLIGEVVTLYGQPIHLSLVAKE